MPPKQDVIRFAKLKGSDRASGRDASWEDALTGWSGAESLSVRPSMLISVTFPIDKLRFCRYTWNI